MAEEQKSMCIVVAAGTIDKLYPAAIMASGGVMNDARVDIFLTFWGLMPFRKGAPAQVQQVSGDYQEYAADMLRAMKAKNVPPWYDTLLQAKEMGDVHVHVCGMTADLFELKMEDFEPIVEDIIGVGEFIDMTLEADSTIYLG